MVPAGGPVTLTSLLFSVKDVVIVSQPNPVLQPDTSQASAGEAPMEAAQGEYFDPAFTFLMS